MLSRLFSRFATWTARRAGHAGTFAVSATIVAVWLVSGPVSRWSDTWQLTINTVSSVVTFLMVFLIQHSQNRDTDALQLKLDELLRATKEARKSLLAVDLLTEEELAVIRADYLALAQAYRAAGEPPR